MAQHPQQRFVTVRLGAADYANLPQFRFEEPPLWSSLERVLPALAVLLVLSLALALGALRRLQRLAVN